MHVKLTATSLCETVASCNWHSRALRTPSFCLGAMIVVGLSQAAADKRNSTMTWTRSAVKLQRTQQALGTYATAWLPSHLQFHVLDLLLQDSTPAVPATGLYVPQPQRPVQQLVHLQLVCKSWRQHIRYHPDALRAMRLYQLLRLVWLHDYVYFIIDGSSRSVKAKLIPASLHLMYPTAAAAAAPQLAQHECSQDLEHAHSEHSIKQQPAQVMPGSGVAAIDTMPSEDAEGSKLDSGGPVAALVTAQDNTPIMLQLEVLNRGPKRGKGSAQALGLPATACILSCSVLDLPEPVHVLKVFASELELLDVQYFSSIILKLHCAGSQVSKQAATKESSALSDTPTAAGSCLSGLSLRARLKLLASHLVSAVMAVECDVEQGILWCIPTHSRINRRVAYNAADPISHLGL